MAPLYGFWLEGRKETTKSSCGRNSGDDDGKMAKIASAIEDSFRIEGDLLVTFFIFDVMRRHLLVQAMIDNDDLVEDKLVFVDIYGNFDVGLHLICSSV